MTTLIERTKNDVELSLRSGTANASSLSPAQSALFDFARGFAAQAVLFGHVLSQSGIKTKAYLQDFGVLLFFLLSGFLITFSVLRKPSSYDFIDFLIDRAARIFVPYLPAIVFIVGSGLLLNLRGPYDIWTVMGNVFLLQDFPLYRYISNIPEIDRVGSGRPLWSVSMEWWFYMGFAGIAFFGRIPKLAIGLVAVGVFIAAFNFTVGMLAYVWVLGSLAAVLWNQTTKVPKKLWMVSLVVFLFLALYRLKIAAWSFYDLQTCLLIGTAFFSASKAIENWPVPVWLTKIGAGCAAFSYSLYLIHYTVMTAVPGWRALLLSNILAVLMWFLFERHYHAVARLLRSGRRAG